MISRTTNSFRKLLRHLPAEVQAAADKAYALWQANPAQPSLDFKQVHASEPIFSARITLGWRAVGSRKPDRMVWFWVGSHNDYDRLLRQL